MVFPNNQVSSPKSMLDDKAFEDSCNDSDFDVDFYLNDEEDNCDNVVVPQTPSEEVFLPCYYVHNVLLRRVKDGDRGRLWFKVFEADRSNWIDIFAVSIVACCANVSFVIDVVGTARDLLLWFSSMRDWKKRLS
ncbi:hypothetical protein Tco_1150218 [Tanacetum coccineum]